MRPLLEIGQTWRIDRTCGTLWDNASVSIVLSQKISRNETTNKNKQTNAHVPQVSKKTQPLQRVPVGRWAWPCQMLRHHGTVLHNPCGLAVRAFDDVVRAVSCREGRCRRALPSRCADTRILSHLCWGAGFGVSVPKSQRKWDKREE